MQIAAFVFCRFIDMASVALDTALQNHKNSQCLYDAAQVDAAIDALAQSIEQELEGSFPLVLCVMNGGLYLTGQLLRRWEFPLTVDYVHATRYRLATLGRDVVWKAYPQNELKDRHVLIVDDILDQGYTLDEVQKYCQKQGAASTRSAFLIKKNHQRAQLGLDADFIALECDDHYVYGCGMDYSGHFRNFSSIYALQTD